LLSKKSLRKGIEETSLSSASEASDNDDSFKSEKISSGDSSYAGNKKPVKKVKKV